MPFHNQNHYLPEHSFPAAVTWAQDQAKQHQKKDVCHNYGAIKLTRTYDASKKFECITLSVDSKEKIKSKRALVAILDETTKKLVEKGFITPKEQEEIYHFQFNTALHFFKRNGPSLKVELKANETVEFTFQGDNLDKLTTDLTSWLASTPQVQPGSQRARL